MNLNTELAPFAHRRAFAANGIVEIPNFFSHESAQRLHTYLAGDAAWEVVMKPDARGEEIVLEAGANNATEIEAATAEVHQRRERGRVAYRFHRTISHRRRCDCVACVCRAFFRSPRMVRWVNDLTNARLERAGEVFTSCYRPGDFLWPHHDGGNGAVAFVYNLSRDWPAEAGGVLHTLDRGSWQDDRAWPPGFNTLVVFRVHPVGTTPHRVSEVAVDAPIGRYAVSGWYRNKETRKPWTVGRVLRAAVGPKRVGQLNRLLHR